jgi:hypothetical protein
MPLKASETYFLHVYDVESGLWANMMLGSPVSPLILEAMNHICNADGILAFIGTRSEFGLYLSELKQETGKDFRHCWTSLPASTIMSMLGLCQNTENPRKPSLVFYGSPLTLTLAYQLSVYRLSGMAHVFERKRESIARQGYVFLEVGELQSIGAYTARMINGNEWEEALTYLTDMVKKGGTNDQANHKEGGEGDPEEFRSPAPIPHSGEAGS